MTQKVIYQVIQLEKNKRYHRVWLKKNKEIFWKIAADKPTIVVVGIKTIVVDEPQNNQNDYVISSEETFEEIKQNNYILNDNEDYSRLYFEEEDNDFSLPDLLGIYEDN